MGHYISLYESSSRIYQELGAYGLYAFLKANYYMGIQRLDSAEWYYRQELFLSQDKNEMEAAYKGLYELFQKRGIGIFRIFFVPLYRQT